MSELKESWNKLFRALSVKIVRYLPFVLLASVALYYTEMLISISANDYTEFVDDAGNVISITFSTPIFDSLRSYLSISLMGLIPLLILSYRLYFCVWLRIPIFALMFHCVLSSYFYDKISYANLIYFCIWSLIAICITIITSVLLRKKFGDRKIKH